jgi:hypothetical protein
MSAIAPPGDLREDFVTPDISRIKTRIYTELIDDALAMRGWTKSELAKQAASMFPELGITVEKVYEVLERPRTPGADFAKALEWTLGINLPPQCYHNAGKR